MHSTIPVLVVSLLAAPAPQLTSARIFGKVVTETGKPVPFATIRFIHAAMKWKIEIKADATGNFQKNGLFPVQFDMEVDAEGFATYVNPNVKPPRESHWEITLLSPVEPRPDTAKRPPNLAETQAAINVDDFGTALVFYNQQRYADALPLLEKICNARAEDRQKPLEGQIPAEPNSAALDRLLGIVLFEVGKQDEVRREELWSQADFLLRRALVQSPRENRLLGAMAEICLAKGDFQGEKHYRSNLAALTHSSPEQLYDLGLQSYLRGDLKEAQTYFLRATQQDASFSNAYFYLALCEFGNRDGAASLGHFQKYLELAPKGKFAPAAKQMLREKAGKLSSNRALKGK